jgi:hypothetical protein
MSNLRTFENVLQRSDEWYDLRRGIITASTVGQLVTAKTIKVAANDHSRALTKQLVAERITGLTDETYQSFDMLRGTIDEPLARETYAKFYDVPVTEIGFMIRDFDGYSIGYSPDGLVGSVGLIEAKSRKAKEQVGTVVEGEVPAENMAQIQGGLLVSEREWCDYLSYCGGMPMWIKRVFPDPLWFAAIREAAQTFEMTAIEMVSIYRARVVGLPATKRTDYSQEIVV